MSKRPEITKELSMSLEKYINPKNDTRIYMAKEVTFDYATGHAIRVDYMKTPNYIVCYWTATKLSRKSLSTRRGS